MTLIDGKQTAATIKAEIKEKVEAIVAAGGKRPHLAAVLEAMMVEVKPM